MFKPYRKIHRLGKEETEGILVGTCYIQEKVDGANTSIWLENGVVRCGSRSQDLWGKSFNGFPEYVSNHDGIQKFFAENGSKYRLYGEWLVRHTIAYKELAYKKFYLFDIYDEVQEKEEAIKLVDEIINKGFHFDGDGVHFTKGKHFVDTLKSGDSIVIYAGISFKLK